MSVKHLYLIAVAATLGCASGSGTPGTVADPPRKSTVITSDEIVRAHADVQTAYDVVARLRPNWLGPHGFATQGSPYAIVFFDGQRYGELAALRSIPAYHVDSITYHDITQAGALYGIKGDSGGVIEVKSKK